MDILPWDIIGVKLEKEKKLKGTKFSSNLLISTTRDWSCIKLATSAISSSFQTSFYDGAAGSSKFFPFAPVYGKCGSAVSIAEPGVL